MGAALDLAYLLAAALFILGLKDLGHPRTAPRGNLLGASGMFVAVVATIARMQLVTGIEGWLFIAGGVALGTIIYLVGGYAEGLATRRVWAYDTVTRTWARPSSSVTAIFACPAASTRFFSASWVAATDSAWFLKTF